MFLPWGYSMSFLNRVLRASRYKDVEREEPKDRESGKRVVRNKVGSAKTLERKERSMGRIGKGERKKE